MTERTKSHDRLLTEMMKDFRMENPPPGFTEDVMERIRTESPGSAYRPLIGRAGWIGIAAGFCILLTFIFMNYKDQSPGEAGWLARRFDSIGIPSIDFKFTDLIHWINHDDPILFWIFTGIAGIVLLAFIQHILTRRPFRQPYTL